ncbi:hypothetical protein D3C86_1728940 [compost metagenome]
MFEQRKFQFLQLQLLEQVLALLSSLQLLAPLLVFLPLEQRHRLVLQHPHQ